MNRLIPYSGEIYGYLLSGYREASWLLEPLTILALVGLLLASRVWSDRHGRILSAAWGLLFAGLIGVLASGFYHQTYQPYNWAGLYFGYAAMAQAGLIAVWGLGLVHRRGRFRPEITRSWDSILALGCLALAAGLGPLLRLEGGEPPVIAQAVGLTPLASWVAFAAIAVLSRAPWWLWPLPTVLVLWEAGRAWVLEIPGDGLLAAAFLGLLVTRALHGLGHRDGG